MLAPRVAADMPCQLQTGRLARQVGGQHLVGLGCKLGRGHEQRSLAVVENVLELGGGKGRGQGHGYAARGHDGEERD